MKYKHAHTHRAQANIVLMQYGLFTYKITPRNWLFEVGVSAGFLKYTVETVSICQNSSVNDGSF
jgi:hypothetical protein